MEQKQTWHQDVSAWNRKVKERWKEQYQGNTSIRDKSIGQGRLHKFVPKFVEVSLAQSDATETYGDQANQDTYVFLLVFDHRGVGIK